MGFFVCCFVFDTWQAYGTLVPLQEWNSTLQWRRGVLATGPQKIPVNVPKLVAAFREMQLQRWLQNIRNKSVAGNTLGRPAEMAHHLFLARLSYGQYPGWMGSEFSFPVLIPLETSESQTQLWPSPQRFSQPCVSALHVSRSAALPELEIGRGTACGAAEPDPRGH